MVTRIVMLTAVLASALVVAQTSAAAIHVSGTYLVTDFGALSCAPVGASPFLVRCTTTGFVSDYTGGLTGTSTLSFVQMIDCRRGRTWGQGIETFTGTVAGVGTGTLTWETSFMSGLDCGTFVPTEFVGRGAIIGGTAALSGLHGPLRFTIDSYEGVLH